MGWSRPQDSSLKNRAGDIILSSEATFLEVDIAYILVGSSVGAHWVADRIAGVVAVVGEHFVTIKTSAGKSVETAFDPKTTYKRGLEPMRSGEIKVGDRVVIHVRMVNRKLTADAVQVRTPER